MKIKRGTIAVEWATYRDFIGLTIRSWDLGVFVISGRGQVRGGLEDLGVI